MLLTSFGRGIYNLIKIAVMALYITFYEGVVNPLGISDSINT